MADARGKKKTMSQVGRARRKELYYRECENSSLVFAPPKVAKYISAIYRALEAPTWSKFKALTSSLEEAVLEWMLI